MPDTSTLTIEVSAAHDVTIDGADTYDADGQLVTFPQRIDTATTYSVTRGAIRISIRRYGLELATDTGAPLNLNMPRDNGLTVTPGTVAFAANQSAPTVSIEATDGGLTISSTDVTAVTGDVTAVTANSAVEIQSQGNVQIAATTDISLNPGDQLRFYDLLAGGLAAADRPALTTQAVTVSVAFANAIRDMLIALGLATDGD